MRAGNYKHALNLYKEVIISHPELHALIFANIVFSKKRIENISPPPEKSNDFIELIGGAEESIIIFPRETYSVEWVQSYLIASDLIMLGMKCIVVIPEDINKECLQNLNWLSRSALIIILGYEPFTKHLRLWASSLRKKKFVFCLSTNENSSPLILKLSKANKDLIFFVSKRIASSKDIKQILVDPNCFQKVDERLFYPRPKNCAIRKLLNLDDEAKLIIIPDGLEIDCIDKDINNLIKYSPNNGKHNIYKFVKLKLVDVSDFKSSAVYQKNDLIIFQSDRLGLPNVLADADIIFYPSKMPLEEHKKFPMDLSEFFAMGKPVVLLRNILPIVLNYHCDELILDSLDPEVVYSAFDKALKTYSLKENPSLQSAFFYRENLVQDLRSYLISIYRYI